MTRLLGCFVTLLSLSMILAFTYWSNKPLPIPVAGIEFVVAKGASMATVAEQLKTLAIIDQPLLLRLYSRFTGADSKLRPGEYKIEVELSPRELLEQLVAGKVRNYSVTLPEGLTLKQSLEVLHAQSTLQKELTVESAWQQLSELVGGGNPEGWFFPDTYIYTAETSDLDLLVLAHRKMRIILEKEST